MATLTAAAAPERSARQTVSFPASSARFEWAFAVLTLWIVGGLYLDGWAHSHGRVDNTFFTPWHAILYSGVGVIAVFLFVNQWRNMDRGYPLTRALPVGYRWSLAGAGLFLLAGGLDLVWHTIFGFEVGLETLLSPTHLLLATSGILIVTGPLRSAFARLTGKRPGWLELGPLLICLLAVLSILTFFTSFVHPVGDYYAAAPDGPDADQYSDLYVMNADGSDQTRLTADPGQMAWGGSWSPDGKKIVFTKGDPASSDSNLYVMNADGSGTTRLLDLPGAEYRADWSPDGRQIAFITDHDHQSDIAIVNADGSDFHRVTETESSEYGPVWSPDSRRIAFTSDRDGADNNVYVMDADGSNVTRLSFTGQYNTAGAWTPDGGHILFSSYRDENTDIYQVDPDGTREVRLTTNSEDDEWPSFTPDGSKILLKSWRGGSSDIYSLDAACLNRPETCDAMAINLTNNHALGVLFPLASPDGSKILFTGSGHSLRLDDFHSQALGIAGVLMQSALLMGLVLLALRRWRLPPGALLLLIGVNGSAMTIFNDHESLIPALLLAALVAEGLLWALRPSGEDRLRFYLFAFLTPMIVYAAYYAAIQVSSGIGWTIHLWLGSLFMAGIVGLFVSFLLLNPLTGDEPAVPVG